MMHPRIRGMSHSQRELTSAIGSSSRAGSQKCHCTVVPRFIPILTSSCANSSPDCWPLLRSTAPQGVGAVCSLLTTNSMQNGEQLHSFTPFFSTSIPAASPTSQPLDMPTEKGPAKVNALFQFSPSESSFCGDPTDLKEEGTD